MNLNISPKIWLAFFVVGTVLPLWAHLPWFFENGLALGLFVETAFANRVSTTITLDVLITGLAVLLLAWHLLPRRQWVYILILMNLVGVSSAFPLMMYLTGREETH